MPSLSRGSHRSRGCRAICSAYGIDEIGHPEQAALPAVAESLMLPSEGMFWVDGGEHFEGHTSDLDDEIVRKARSSGGRSPRRELRTTFRSVFTHQIGVRYQLVDVIDLADTLQEARAAVDAAPGATPCAFADPGGYLTDDQLAEAAQLADRVVLFLPGFDELRAFAPESPRPAHPATSTASRRMLPAGRRARGHHHRWRTVVPRGGRRRRPALLPQLQRGLLCREHRHPERHGHRSRRGRCTEQRGITGSGNAALALNLLGEDDTLVWYVPTAGDLVADGPADIASLTPDWVTPVLLLAASPSSPPPSGAGARLGALVVENLPVTVRSRETMEGRARLYAKAGAHTHALDSLRIGTITRLSSVLGLPRNASVDEVASSAAGVLPGGRSATSSRFWSRRCPRARPI